MTNVVVIDYGMGNLHSIAKALQHVGANDVLVSSDPDAILAADHVVLPGVGAIRDCIAELKRLELIDVIKRTAATKPFLGICLGMHALMSSSEENDGTSCLQCVPGIVHHFDKLMDTHTETRLKIPHMGWNQVEQRPHPLWQGIAQSARFYFVHSYYVAPQDDAVIAGTTNYPAPFVAAMGKDSLFAVQFHPEKSQRAGLQLLANFIHWNGTISKG